jgi:hypothetical protein
LLATEQSRMRLQANFLLKSAVVNTSQGRHRAKREWQHHSKAEGEASLASQMQSRFAASDVSILLATRALDRKAGGLIPPECPKLRLTLIK